MKFAQLLVILSCALWEAMGYPYYPAYGNVDSVSYGSTDSARGGLALSRYYNPYYNSRAAGAGMAAFMFRQPEPVQQSGQYYLPDRRRKTNLDYVPPQQNEVFYPQQPDQLPEEQQPEQQQPEAPVIFPTQPTELAEPTEKIDIIPTTLKTIVPELAEPEVPEVEEVEEPAPKPKKGVVSKKKQVKRPIDDDDEDEGYAPKMPSGAFFPMFFGWGGRGGSGGSGVPVTAIANAYSMGRGGVATSHATAYGAPRPESQYLDNRYKKN